nr:replication endonuclease [Pseudoalteromonas sp. Of7M-16]
MQPICITAKAPFCYTQFGFDAVAERTKELLRSIPTNRLRRIAAHGYVKRFHSTTAKNPERSANIYLRKLVARVTEILEKTPLTVGELNSSKRRKEKAKQLALICTQMCIVDFDESTTLEDAEQLVFACYIKAVDFTLSQGITPPYLSTFNNACSVWDRCPTKCKACDTDELANKLERGIKRMCCDKWWIRKLKRIRDTTLEHLNITMGLVRKNVSPYASKDAVQEFRSSRKSQAEWVDSMQIESEAGHEVDLREVFDGSVSNPEIRRIETIVRIRGYAEWAKYNEMKGMFYTITAPSKYHANSSKYNNASPKDTQNYLVSQWAKVRATLAKEKIKFFGLRIVEPHQDATPHWHMLMFMRDEDELFITGVMRRFALQEDADEKGADKNRFDAVEEDPDKGDAVAYIIKYISKNINGAHCDGMYDDETGLPIDEDGVVMNIGAWASRWRIRQFQFIGGAPIGIWREFRRFTEQEIEKLAVLGKEIFEAADNSRFSEFIELLGGAFATRKERPVAIAKEGDGENDYGEAKSRVVGVAMSAGTYVTRAIKWVLKKRGAPASPWSTGNNCNPEPNDWQVRHGDKLNPINLIPPEIRNSVQRGARYIETDEINKTVTEYSVLGGQLMQESVSYV